MYKFNHNLSVKLLVIIISFCILQICFSQVEPIQAFYHPTDFIAVTKFSPDKSKLITGRGYARLWDIQSGNLLIEYKDNTNIVSSAAFSPDGKLIATGDWYSHILIWYAETGKTLHKIYARSKDLRTNDFGNQIIALAFTPDGKRLLSGTNLGTPKVRYWDVETGEELRYAPVATGASSFEFSANGKYVLVGKYNVLLAETGEKVFTAPGGDITISSFSGEGNKLISYVAGKEWALPSGVVIREFPPLEVEGRILDISPDGVGVLASNTNLGASLKPQLKGIQTDGKTQQLRVFPEEYAKNGAKFSPDGKYVLTISGNTAYLWDVSDVVPAVRDGEIYEPNQQ